MSACNRLWSRILRRGSAEGVEFSSLAFRIRKMAENIYLPTRLCFKFVHIDKKISNVTAHVRLKWKKMSANKVPGKGKKNYSFFPVSTYLFLVCPSFMLIIVAAAWKPWDFSELDSSQSEPDSAFFLSGREAETLPHPSARLHPLPTDRTIKVGHIFEIMDCATSNGGVGEGYQLGLLRGK